MKWIKKGIVYYVVIFSIVAMAGCGEQRTSENTDNLKKSNTSEQVSQEKIIFLPEKIGVEESMIMFNGTDDGEARKLVDGELFSTYVIDAKSQVIALCRDKGNFYMLFAQDNSYAIVE